MYVIIGRHLSPKYMLCSLHSQNILLIRKLITNITFEQSMLIYFARTLVSISSYMWKKHASDLLGTATGK